MRLRRSHWIAVLACAAGALAGTPSVASADLAGNGTVSRLPTGNVQSSPAAVHQPNSSRTDVVVRGSDNQIWFGPSDGTTFFPWTPLGFTLAGGAKGDPTIVSWEFGREDVFVRGPDDKLWQSSVFGFGGGFQPWIRPVGDQGVLASSPRAAVRGPGRLDVFVRGTDGGIYQRFWDTDHWNSEWISHGQPSGTTLVGDPAAVWSSPTRLDIFARGSDDKLWQRTWNGAGWSAWARPVGTLGTLASSPAATAYERVVGGQVVSGNIAVFVRGTDGGVWGIDFSSGTWGNWVRFGQPGDVIQDSPGAASRPFGHLDVFGRGLDNQAYWYSFQLAM